MQSCFANTDLSSLSRVVGHNRVFPTSVPHSSGVELAKCICKTSPPPRAYCDNVNYILLSTIPFLIAYGCHNLLWWISFNFLLKVFMKITVYLVLPSIVAFRIHRFYREGSPLHGYMGSPVTIKKPKLDNSTGFPSKFEHYPFVNSKSQDYVIPQHLSDESNWRRWFSDGAFISRESGKGRIACKPFASGCIRDAFYLILDNEPGKL